MNDRDIMIKAENVSKIYYLGQLDGHSFIKGFRGRKREEFLALSDINFEVKRGEVVGIIGANGAGKSTLLKVLSQITVPSKGCVYLNGNMSSMLEVGTGFHPELSGRENIYVNGTILGMTRKEIDEKLEAIIDFSECRQFIDTPVKRYSSGMYVKLAFSVAAFLDSDIMVLDEVLSVGDVKFQAKCLNKIKELSSSENRTVLCVSHNMNTISKFCDRCMVLDGGRLIFDGDTADAIRLYFGKVDKSDVYIDYSQMNRFTWLSTDDVRLQTVKCLDKSEMVFCDDEQMNLSFNWLYKNNVLGLGLRVEIFDDTDNPVGAAMLYGYEDGKAGKNTSISVRVDISRLREGKYKTLYTLFIRNSANETVDLDCVDGLSFEKQMIKNKKIAWSRKCWGSLELPELSIVNESGNSQ